jgi:hypothetical protein
VLRRTYPPPMPHRATSPTLPQATPIPHRAARATKTRRSWCCRTQIALREDRER